MGYELLLAFAVAGAAYVTVFSRRRGSSWWDVLGLNVPLLGFAGFAAAMAFLSGLAALLVGSAILLPALWISLRRSQANFTGQQAPIALPDRVDPDDPAEIMVRETDLADAAEEQRAFRRRMMRVYVGPAALLVGGGALLGSWPLAVLGGAIVVAGALMRGFVRDLRDSFGSRRNPRFEPGRRDVDRRAG